MIVLELVFDVKRGDLTPLPSVDDLWKEAGNGEWLIKPCTCNGRNSIDWENIDCGPHLVDRKTGDRCPHIAGRFSKSALEGWYRNGRLYCKSDNQITTSTSSIGPKCICNGPPTQVPLGIGGNCQVIEVCSICKLEK